MGSSRRCWRKALFALFPKTHRMERPRCLENPRPKGGIYQLTENARSPFQAEPGHALGCLLCSTIALLAQSGGAITGTVVDLSGDPVAKAEMQATNAETKVVYNATTSSTGVYTFAQLPAGTYQLSNTTPGFMPFIQRNVKVTQAETLQLTLHFQDIQLNTLGDGREFYAFADTLHPAPTGPAPGIPDGKPDLSGMWYQQRTVDRGKTEMKAWAEFDLPRQVFLDGRGHPNDWNPTWLGHSIGHWDGDTLVVDSIGFNDKAWFDGGGIPHTERMHVTQRFHRADLGHLEIEVTIEDPDTFTKPWVIKRAAELAPNDEIQEYVCTENEHDRPRFDRHIFR